MKQKHFFWKNLSRCMRAFLILSLVFLAVGLGTLGFVRSTGDAYRLPVKRSGDGKQPSVTLHITEPGHGEEEHEHKDLYIKNIYVNAGTVYSEYGKAATLKIGRGVSSSSDFYSSIEIRYVNMYQEVSESDANVYTDGGLFNWVSAPVPEGGWRLATYPYFQFRVEGCDLLLNEVVFVAAEKPAADSTEFIGKDYLLNAEVFASASNLPRAEGETEEEAVKKASAIVDNQYIPSVAQSSYFRFGKEEAQVLSTVVEMGQDLYFSDNVYHLSSEYNSFGLDLLALSTAIFGTSPFGLRLLPFLASFGVLVFGALLARRFFGSDRACLVFAVLYALAGVPLTLGHFGTPIMIGIFFAMASLYFCYGFYRNGMKEAKFSSAVPVLLSGLFAAAAIATQGALLIPVLGIVGLFVAGVIRQRKRCRAELDEAIEEVEAEKAELQAKVQEQEQSSEPSDKKVSNDTPAMRKVAAVLNGSRFKQTASIAVFVAFLVVGALLISVLSVLPLYSVYGKVYGGGESRSIFTYLWQSFAGGFVASSTQGIPSVSNVLYPVFEGMGSSYAVTSAGILIAIAPVVMGLIGLIFAIVRLAKGKCDKDAQIDTVILLVGVVLSLVTASFAGGGVGFLFLAYVLLFLFASRLGVSLYDGEEEAENGQTKTRRPLVWTCLGIAIACFVLFAVLIFSIPLPSSFMNPIFK